MSDTREILMRYLYPMGRYYDNGGINPYSPDWILGDEDLDKLINDLDNRL
jgi:hypothetical protein